MFAVMFAGPLLPIVANTASVTHVSADKTNGPAWGPLNSNPAVPTQTASRKARRFRSRAATFLSRHLLKRRRSAKNRPDFLLRHEHATARTAEQVFDGL